MMTTVTKDELVPTAVARLRSAHTLLEIGPGIQPQTFIPAMVHVCVEPFTPYAETLSAAHPDYLVLNCTWEQALEVLLPGSVDTVILMDVIEHLEKADGRALLDATIPLARRQVVIHTPLGFLAQGEDEEKDAWGMNGVDWQIHRSGWLPEDFPGWDIVVCERFHLHDAYGRQLDPPPGAFFAILDRGEGHSPEPLNELVSSLVRQDQELRSSTSWRITRPVRWLGGLLGRG